MKMRYFWSTLVLTLVGANALAGLTREVPVEVDLENGIAAGSQITAKTSANDLEYIGCGVRRITFDGGFDFRFGFCQAGDANGNTILCFTENPSLLDEMRANSSYAFILFHWQDDGFGGAECTRVGFSTQSVYLPDKKVK